MHHNYEDIRSRIQEEPKWFDERAVPCYCDFAPKEVADIYAHEIALVEIACQACGTRFLVAFSWNEFRSPQPLRQRIADKSIHYGDPPNTDCCPAGATMNCIDIRVVEFWSRPRFEWIREPELEIEIEDINEYFDDEQEGYFQMHSPED